MAAWKVMEESKHVLLVRDGAERFASEHGLEIGDTPIIGAGTYANNKTCTVSATGHGEYFIRYTIAHDISALMEYKGLSLEQAAGEVIF